jgi:hypothetical protein
VAHLVDRDPRSPNLDHDFTTEWAAWAYDQVRRGTPAGLALGPYVTKYQGIDPKKDNSSAQPVQQAADRLLIIRTSKTANEALQRIGEVHDAQSAISNGIDAIKEQLDQRENAEATAAEKAKQLADRVRPVQNIAGSLQLTSYLFEIGGNRDAARTVGGLANAATGVANLMQTAATAAPMALAAGYVGVAIAVVSAFQSAHEGSSPFPAIFEMLQRISQQIESLRAELSNSIAALDVRLSTMVAQTTILVDAVNYNVQQVQHQVSDLRILQDSYNIDNAQRVALLVGLIQGQEDRECFQWTGDQHLLPLKACPELVSPPPEAIRQIRRELRIDYGKIDYAIDSDGIPVLFDVNKTIGLPRPYSERARSVGANLADGLISLVTPSASGAAA